MDTNKTNSTVRVTPGMLSDVRKFGNFDVSGCYACGSCAVQCPLTTDITSFPRRLIRFTRIGAKESLTSSLDPWLCYYCGDCSKTCPRQAEPGEAMMTLRRYLIGQYDWTGLSSRFFKSKAWEVGVLIVVGLAMLASILLFFHPFLHTENFLEFGHLFTLIAVFVVVLFIFLPNVFRMYWFSVGKSNLKVPFLLYLRELKTLVIPAFTHQQFRMCKEKSLFWLKHWFVAAGYILTLTSVIAGWVWTTYTYPLYHPLNLWGIVGNVVLLVSLTMLIIDRAKKVYAQHKFSELSDWLFIIWLFAFVFSLSLSYIFLSLGIEGAGYFMLTVFLVLLGPWALILVPFSKTPHLLYRPFATYFQSIKEKALQLQNKQ